MADQFICFFDTGLSGDEERDRVPIATASTRDEAMNIGIPRMLEIVGGDAVAMQYSSVAVVSQPNLTADEFANLAFIVEQNFTKGQSA